MLKIDTQPVQNTQNTSRKGTTPLGQVEHLARNLAGTLKVAKRPARDFPIDARLKALNKSLKASYHYFEKVNREQALASRAAEWVLDNFYVIEQAIRQVAEDMPVSFYRHLPHVTFRNGKPTTRIFILSYALTRLLESRIDIEIAGHFIKIFQTEAELRIGESWALGSMLRLSVLETLAQALANITQSALETSPLPAIDSPGNPADETVAINAIVSLRMLATQDWKSFFENTSQVEKTMCQDPAGIYQYMDFESRNLYRNEVEQLASGSYTDDISVARAAILLSKQASGEPSRHIGYYLVGEGRPELEKSIRYRPTKINKLRRWLYQHAIPAYLGSITVLTSLLVLIAAAYASRPGGNFAAVTLGILFSLLPASAVAVDLVNWLVIQHIPPRILPKLDFRNGIPAECHSIVVIPTLLKNETDLLFLLQQLERHSLGNADPNLHFALLTDFYDAPQKELPGEDKLIEQAENGIRRLNTKYGKKKYRPFLLFHRERIWNPGEDCWMGWERKRGKLAEFNNLLHGDKNTSYTVQVGDLGILSGIRYVIPLDTDTTLPRESAFRMVGTLAHPLNQAKFDPVTGQVTSGYTVLQPRVQVRPDAANLSLFTRIYSGDVSLDLYSRAVSDVYQDLFGEGSYVGKGIYDVKAFARSLDDRVPDNTLLSHDLFEGIHGRCGLVTDVIVFEDYPPHYLTFIRRMHRWVRGDWQLLPWLGRYVPSHSNGHIPNTLSLLSRWKIIDNLRRSLIPPATIILLLTGWMLPGAKLFWTLLALSPYALAVAFSLLARLGVRNRQDEVPGVAGRPIYQAVLRSLFEIIFLPHESLIILDAIGTTLVRLTITHKRLLQWVTAAHTVTIFGRELKIRVAWREMVGAPVFALILLVTIANWQTNILPTAFPLILSWLLSPYIAARISRPISHAPQPLSQTQQNTLRLLARTTWLYFEHFIGPDDHWLPPDHYQEDPRGLVAHRTSPTNIGLLLLSTLSAWDLGYIGPQDFVLRIRNTFDGMDGLERHRGHFLNWYNTRNLAPLPPRYISTVDSGNLAACLLTLRQGCRDIASRPVVHWAGLVDTLDVLTDVIKNAKLGKAASQLTNVIQDMHSQATQLSLAKQCSPTLLNALFAESRLAMENLLIDMVEKTIEPLDPATLHQLSTWEERTRHHLNAIQRDLESLCPWSLMMPKAPAPLQTSDASTEMTDTWLKLTSSLSLRSPIESIPDTCTRARKILQHLRQLLSPDAIQAIAWCDEFSQRLVRASLTADNLLEDLQDIRKDADGYFKAMDYRFLFNAQRQVFHIGCNVETNRLDPNYYDLLASEARIASLIAIAKGDVPLSHWLYLSRPLTQLGGERLLLSWSGTMFEYLMPTLLVKNYPESLLTQSCRAAVQYQISYGREKGVPWGISESSFYYFDSAQTYQYRAFGAPGLGYKRGLSDDMVVAPYASLLALPFAPQDVVENLEHLQRINAKGAYGLYESVDFTASRLAAGQEYAIIRTYMAHHQGMSLLALNNHLNKNPMPRRLHTDPRMESVELLLQEQTPLRAPVEYPHPHEVGAFHPVHSLVDLNPWQANPNSPYPQLHCITNGKYSLLITAAGSGYSRWGEVDLTRWRADTTLDNWGTWLYVQDLENGQTWSATHQPVAAPAENPQTRFYPHKITFERKDGDIGLRMTVSITPDDDVEIRRVTITNHGERTRQLTLTSYGEVILSLQSADRRHPAFNRMFVESEYMEEDNILLFRRRPRLENEKAIYLAHLAVSNFPRFHISGYESDRARFIGRGHTTRAPQALELHSAGLSGTTGATLDPIFAIQASLTLLPYESAEMAFITLAAGSRYNVINLAQEYSQWSRLRNTDEEATRETEQEMLRLDLVSSQLEQIEKLLSILLYPSPVLRADPAILAANTQGQPGLWPFAISGDYPILLVRLKSENGLELLNELVKAHTYWRRRGLKIDLVILNRQETSYEQDFNGRIFRLLGRNNSESWLNKRGGIFILQEDQMNASNRTLIVTAARVMLEEDRGSLETQLSHLDNQPVRLPHFVAVQPPMPIIESANDIARPDNLLFDNGLGGFSPDGREYQVYLSHDKWTPTPWVNVIANSGFGFLVSESGMGCTWAQNSGENRLTPWHNDPVCDPPSEAIYLRDEDTGQIWSPTPLPARANAPYLIRHGAGYSIFEHTSHGLEQQLTLFAAPHAPVKIIQLKLQNSTSQTRRINITYYIEWVLGSTRDDMSQFIVPEFDSQHFAILARNPYNTEFGEDVAFLAASREIHWVTTDRSEFLGPMGSYARPAALDRVGLSARVQAGADPCAAMQILLWLAPDETKEVTFLLGQGTDRATAMELIHQFQDMENVNAAWDATKTLWDDLLGGIQVHTPDLAMDLLLNRWLLYESLACRIWGRTAFYQSSGAFGYRDQLQDVLALLNHQPDLAREHILRAASHQFEQGDVLHWWHPPAARGIRTRIKDNLLWLPYVTARYVRTTGDLSILQESVPFLCAPELGPGEDERYGLYTVGEETASLFEHCCRAIEKGTDLGKSGLPLMGTGDWNDGMNRVGIQGKGESIWLGWFLLATLDEFATVCDLFASAPHAETYRKWAETLKTAIETHGWDGGWYRRARYDDGTPLGSDQNTECKIDSISQSWAVISGGGSPGHTHAAMDALEAHLVHRNDQLIALLWPPFDRTIFDPGYIKGYPPGIRENGGQYTHAACWTVWAFAEMGEGDKAAEFFKMLNPILHTDSPEKLERYRVEPYVVAADIYSVPPHNGRGGWTWYTGSASWMYRLGVEMLLGLRREGSVLRNVLCNVLRIVPSIPKSWPGYEMDYRFGSSSYHIRVENPDRVSCGMKQISLDGNLLPDANIPLNDDGQKHEVLAIMGNEDPKQPETETT